MDNLNACNSILTNIGEDFLSLLRWTKLWVSDIRDCVVFNGMMPYYAMFIQGANEFFRLVGLKANGKELYEKMPIIDTIRGQCIKLYNYEMKGVGSSIKKNYDWLLDKDKKLQRYYQDDEINNYELYKYRNEVINNFHLMEKQLETDIGIYKDIDESLSETFAYIIKKTIIFANLFNADSTGVLDLKIPTFMFANKTHKETVRINKQEKSGVYIALIDIISSINFYNHFIKQSCLTQLTIFKIKYVLLSQCASSIRNISIYEKSKYGYKTLNDKEFEIIHNINQTYIKNIIVNLCKHYYNNKIDIEMYGTADFLSNIIESNFKCSFKCFDEKIDELLLVISEIINRHFYKI